MHLEAKHIDDWQELIESSDINRGESMTKSEVIDAAFERYCPLIHDDIEIDSDAAMEESEAGCWIQAWV